MQANNSPRFLKNFMIGLVASSAGAFIALPGTAMPEPTETGAEVEAMEEIPAPVAADALPEPGAEAFEADAMEMEMLEADTMEMDAEPVAEESTMEMEAEPVAEEPLTEEDAVADDITPDADTVEAADIEALSEDAIEASDTMDGEPVVEEPSEMEAEPVADEATMEEEPIADEMEVIEEEPVADEAPMEAEPVAGEAVTGDFTIAELTDSDASFEILAAALAAADLTETLGSEGPFTVFAPTDDAFAFLPEGAVQQLLEPENKDALVQFLTYHVVPGAVLSTELETGSVETLEGREVAIDTADGVTVNNAKVVVADVEASNGVIHIIDRVMIPPTPEVGTPEAPAEDGAIAE